MNQHQEALKDYKPRHQVERDLIATLETFFQREEGNIESAMNALENIGAHLKRHRGGDSQQEQRARA